MLLDPQDKKMKLENIILPDHPTTSRFDVEISSNTIQRITPHSTELDGSKQSPPSLLLPPLCHPHIHLDKPYLLTSHSHSYRHGDTQSTDSPPDYSDLVPSTGTFSEALSNTSAAKARYTTPDLVHRGSQLLAESVQAGVTTIRAFVEIDHVTGFKCLEAAVQLKRKFGGVCRVQICAFAQDPVMSGEFGGDNRRLMEEAVEAYPQHIEVVGSTPYVEQSREDGVRNIRWAVELALEKKLHLDFHLDYNLDQGQRPLVWDVVEVLKEYRWVKHAAGRTVALGHCSRMTLLKHEDMERLATDIREAQLPIAFVGLPTSDLFMMGRPSQKDDWGGNRPRGTLQILEMIKTFGLQACIGVNNVGNAFTPWGPADPLRVASLGVGLYQAGTEEDAKLLYECISVRAIKAIGLAEEHAASPLKEGGHGPFLMIRNRENIECEGLELGAARQRQSIADVVWDPPELNLRQTLRGS